MISIILTGGTSRRFGSDKSSATIGNQTLLEILVSYLGETDLVIVGSQTDIKARYLRETPLHSGPVAAVGAAINFVEEELVSIFATDMPFSPLILPRLIEEMKDDAALPIDREGFAQPLAGLYRVSALKAALHQYETYANQSMKSLVAKLAFNPVRNVIQDYLLDIDKPEDLEKARQLRNRLFI